MVEKLNGVIELLNRCGDLHWHFAAAMFLQVGILVAVLVCVDLCLRRRVRPVFRYWMWMLVIVKLLLPVSLGSPTSPAYWLPENRPADARPAVAPVPPTSAVASTMTPVVLEEASGLAPVRVSERVPQAARTMIAGGEGEMAKSFSAPPAAAALQPAPVQLVALRPTAWLLLAWLATVAALLATLGQRTWKVRRLVQRAVEAPPDLRDLLGKCQALVGLRPHLGTVKICGELGSPAICGLWRPTILLPRALVDKLDRQQMQLVFVHELAHWKRGDLQVNCLQTLLQIVYFYNPAVWIANAVVRRLREQAVDETVLVAMGPQSERYPSTLLDVAALTLRPPEFALRLIGVVESRKALAERIRRIVGGRIPKSAKLGLVGLAAILVLGLVLLPMAARDRSGTEGDDRVAASGSASDEATESEPKRDASAGPETAPGSPSAPQAALSGRITDETGAPVTDAEIRLNDSYHRVRLEAKTDGQGHYRFDEIPQSGEYQVRIESQRWVGITSHRELPRIHLTPESRVVRDFKLTRACRLRIQTVDRQGKPISGVSVYPKLLGDKSPVSPEGARTDKQGWALLGGMKCSESDYLLGIWSRAHGLAKLVIKLDDPENVVSRQIVLDQGVEVKGTALCSDGKPPAGWRINALPTWWDFGRYPSGQVIGPDGSFTLPNVVPGEYRVSISVPVGPTTSTFKEVFAGSLTDLEGPLAVTLDHPSPGSMAAIAGRIRYQGGAVKRGFWIHANSDDRQHHGGVYLKAGQEEFRIEPLPRGVYTVRFESTEIESKALRGIRAPTEDLDVEITVSGRPVLRGAVVRGDTGEPVNDFRARVTKLRTLRGPNYVVEPRWQEFRDAQGRFEIEVPGPGIYVVQAAVDGFTLARSEPINSDQDGDKPVEIKLTRGVSLSGTVVDEEGNPVDGATVIPLSKASGGTPIGAGDAIPDSYPDSLFLRLFATETGAVNTAAGRFTIDDLTPGQEILKVTHPDFRFAIVRNVEVGQQRAEELKITLSRGATVRGHVYDEQGKPQANVTLHFQNDSAYSGGSYERLGRLATVVTDENGYYEVHHLPDELCYVRRDDEWNCWGVVRQAILPEEGKIHTLDFGGQARLTGRLSVNNAPFANGKLQLSDDSPRFGIFRAYGQTASDGSFTFHGVQPGKRTLYYAIPGRRDDWVRVKDVEVTSADVDLGTIDHVAGTVSVRCVADDGSGLGDLHVSLQEYNPIWAHGNDAGVLRSREDPNDPFLFEQVPIGKYELICRRADHFVVRRLVEVTAESLEQELTCKLPAGTASLEGKLDGAICGPGGCSRLKVWSKDQSLLGYIFPKEDGTYRLENIPAGEYTIREKDTRTADVLLEVSLNDGQNKTLDLMPEVITSSITPKGFLVIRPLTAEGVPLPCEVQLTGPGGALPPNSTQWARFGFVGAPGSYELSLTYPGFKPHRRTVELKPVGADGRAAEGSELFLHLQADDD